MSLVGGLALVAVIALAVVNVWMLLPRDEDKDLLRD